MTIDQLDKEKTFSKKTYNITGGGGIQLYVEETGNPGGQPIVFIHGYSHCRLVWNKQMTSDLADDFRLVAFDIRGHGLSEKPRDAYGDSQLWADDIDSVITTLELEQPVLSGWSYGGAILCDYLRCYGEEHIGGLHFVGAGSKMGPSGMPFLGKDFVALSPGFNSDEVEESAGALQAFLRLCVYEELAPEDFYFMLGYSTIVPPHVRAGLIDRSLDNDDLLSNLRKPVLITQGEEDAIMLPEMAKHHADIISQAQVSYYPNTGHAAFWEDPERFNRELRNFALSI